MKPTQRRQRTRDQPGKAAVLAGLLAALLAAPASAAALTGYDPERGAFIATPDGSWELKPYAMVQLTSITRTGGGQPTGTDLAVHAAKFILHGHIFAPSLTYQFQINAGDGKVVAEDIYLHWQTGRYLGLLAGQIEVPFNRQHITLEAYQQFVQRSLVDGRFNLHRNTGLAAYVSTPARRLEWTSGVWAAAASTDSKAPPGYLLTTRLSWNPLGPIPFRESDLAVSRLPKLSLAAAGAYDTAGVLQGVGEVTLRWRGASLTAEGHLRRRGGHGEVDYGAFVQLGLPLVPHHLEVDARYGAIGGALAKTDADREVTAGLSYYFFGHRLKVQGDYSRTTSAGAPVQHRVLAQLEFFL